MIRKISKDLWLHQCNRCEYEWASKTKEPKTCANTKCKSPYWNKERIFPKRTRKQIQKQLYNISFHLSRFKFDWKYNIQGDIVSGDDLVPTWKYIQNKKKKRNGFA